MKVGTDIYADSNIPFVIISLIHIPECRQISSTQKVWILQLYNFSSKWIV